MTSGGDRAGRGVAPAGLKQRFADLRDAARAMLGAADEIGALQARLEQSGALRRMRELRDRAPPR